MMEALVEAALAGTAGHPGPPLIPENEADALLATVPAQDREHQFLLRAGAWSLRQQCGQVARRDVPRLQPAPPGTTPLINRRWVDVLSQTFTAEKRGLLIEFLRAMKEHQVDLPYDLLPLALDQKDDDVRGYLLPVLGERGQWVAALNADWNWATTGAERLSTVDQTALRRAWEEGTLGQRCLALSVLRRSDPDEARRWLDAALPQEKADHRARFVEQLLVELRDADEPLLERLLEDRSEPVRAQAALLLRQLPGSQYSRRMRERGHAMLHVHPNAKTFSLRCTPPAEIGADWLRDGIPPRTPHGRGKRAFWAEIVLGSVPPDHWVAHFQKTPPQLVAAVQGDEYAGNILMAWTLATCRFGGQDSSWAEALWDVAASPVRNGKGVLQADEVNRLVALLRVMPAALAESKVEGFVSGDAHRPEVLARLVEALPRPWSVQFGRAYLRQARRMVASAMIDLAYEWLKTLPVAAMALPIACLDEAMPPWEFDRGDKSWTASAVAQDVERFRQLVGARQSFYVELRKSDG